MQVELSIEETINPENQFQLSTDETFASILRDETVRSNNLLVSELQSNQLFYWRVKSINACGESDWSETFSFRTSELFCASISYLGDAVTIGDGAPNEIFAPISLPYLFNVENVDLTNVTGTHTFISDLIVSLSFDGKSSQLFSDICGSNEDYNVGFSDASPLNIIPCPPTSREIYVPETPLSTFNGSRAFGDWILSVDDNAFEDGGTLDAWSMEVCYSSPIAPIIVPEQNIMVGCNDTEILLSLIHI